MTSLSSVFETGLHERLSDVLAVKFPVDVEALDLDGRDAADAIRDIAVAEFGEADRRSVDLGDQKKHARIGEMGREFLQREVLRHVGFYVLSRIHRRKSVVECAPGKLRQGFGIGGRSRAD